MVISTILISVIFFLFSVFYLHYNLRVFQQLFAHYFYVETQAKRIENPIRNNFNCITVNIVRSDSFLDRNEYILRGGSIAYIAFEYDVNGKLHQNTRRKRSYIDAYFRCDDSVDKAYYFPLFPSWSVVENKIPDPIYMKNFFVSSAKYIGLLLFYLSFLSYRKRKSKTWTLTNISDC